MRFTGRVALITAAGRGIGRATAEIIGREGGTVVAVEVDKECLDQVVGGIRAAGGSSHGLVADALDGAQVSATVRRVVDEHGRIDILEKHGRKLHIKPSHLQWADRWFERYGDATVFLSRMLPIIRTFISLPAGVARMPFWRFTVLTTLGCIPWIFMLTFIGQQVGDRWEQWKDSLHYIDYAVAACLVVGVAYLVVRRWRGGSGEPADEVDAGARAEDDRRAAADAVR